MIRLFDLRDLSLVHRLRDQYISFHAETAMTDGVRLFRSALAGMFVERDAPTYVWKAEDSPVAGIARIQLRENGEQARLIVGGISMNGNGDYHVEQNGEQWLPFLDELVYELGQRGAHNLVVELSEQSGELPILRQSGFAIYTRQDIWALQPTEVPAGNNLLKVRKPEDDWDINLLYANTVPRLIQLVEPSPPLHDGPGWVLREDDELVAFVQRHDGHAGSWLRLFVHPGAHTQTEEIALSSLQLRSAHPAQPLYCCVPRYQSWLQGALQKVGFELFDSQVVMVKHTVARIQKEIPVRPQLMPANQVVRSTPYIQNQQGEISKRRDKTAPI